MSNLNQISIFCRELWEWYALNKRTLPWRDLKEKDPNQRAYLILVSEIMLQQTQVPRVIIKYKEFVQRFPRMEDLAKASNAEVLIAWKGMGYNSRALRLRDAARILSLPSSPNPFPRRGKGSSPLPSTFAKATVDRSGEGWRARRAGVREAVAFPRSMEELMNIPGIGPYTAAAILNFAFDIPTPCIDTNIRRILHRFFVGPENADGTWKKNDRELLKIAGRVLEVALGVSKGSRRNQGNQRNQGSQHRSSLVSLDSLVSLVSLNSSSWHAALMDFGSLVMTKTNPKWELLSPELGSICKAYGKGKVRTKKVIKTEPGIDVDGRFIPRRIIRGKVVEALRDARGWMSIDEVIRKIGFESVNDQVWIDELLRGLKRDGLVEMRGSTIRLHR